MATQTASSVQVGQGGRSPLKHEKLSAMVKARIRAGEFKPGDRLPSEADLAQEMNISRHTILRALSSLSAEGWIERQQGRGTFVAERPCQGGVGCQTVALICSDQGDGLMGRVIQGVSRALRASRRELLVLDSDHDVEREGELLGSLFERRLGGAILWPQSATGNQAVVGDLLSQNFPLVLIDCEIEGVDAPLVCVDHELGAYQVTRHLLELGHRRIAHITFDRDVAGSRPVVESREAGYCRALEEWGIARDESLVKYIDPALARLAYEPAVRSMLGYEQVHQLLRLDDQPTAFFMLNDIFAASVLRAVSNQGLRVPEDVVLAGFNNDPDVAGLAVPLTSYDQEPEKLGYCAAEMVARLVQSPRIDERRRVLPGRLVVRHSTDPASVQSAM